MTAKITRPRKVREVTNGFVIVIEGTAWIFCDGQLSLAFERDARYTAAAVGSGVTKYLNGAN